MRLAYILLLWCLPLLAADGNGHFYVSFGPASLTTSATGWNNITEAAVGDTSASFALVDSTGAATDVTLRFTGWGSSAGYGNIANGLAMPMFENPYPYTVSAGHFKCASGGAIAWTVSGLTGSSYSVRVVSLRGVGPESWPQSVVVGGTTKTINAGAYNQDGTATWSGVVPTAGAVAMSITGTASFTYVNGLEITPNVFPVASVTSSAATLKPPFQAPVRLDASASTAGSGTISAYAWYSVILGGAAGFYPPTTADYGAAPRPWYGSTQTIPVGSMVIGSHKYKVCVTNSNALTSCAATTITVTDTVLASEPARSYVVIGSSSAQAGADTTNYLPYLQTHNASSSAVNLAQSGYSTRSICPTGSANCTPNTSYNITNALGRNPHFVIVDLRSNDTMIGIPLAETQQHYRDIWDACVAAKTICYFTTPHPVTATADQRANQIAIRDWLLATFPYVLDYWTDFVDPATNQMRAGYDSGDGIHLNNTRAFPLCTGRLVESGAHFRTLIPMVQ